MRRQWRGGEEHCVGNGLDRGRVDVVVDGVDMPVCDVLAFQVLLLLLKETSRRNTTSTSGIHNSSSGTRTSSQHWHVERPREYNK